MGNPGTLRYRLHGGFALVLLLLAVSVGTGFWTVARLTAATRHITDVSGPKERAAAEVKFAVTDLYQYQTGYVLSDHVARRAEFRWARAEAERRLATLASVSRTQDERALIADIRSQYRKFLALDEACWAAVRAGDIARAQHISETSEATQFRLLTNAIDRYVSKTRDEQSVNVDHFERTTERTRLISVLLVVLALAVAGLFAYLARELERRAVQLRAQDERFRSLIQNSSDVIVVVDREHRVVYHSPSAERSLGYQPGELLGASWLELVEAADQPVVREALEAVAERPQGCVAIEAEVRRPGSAWRHVEINATNLLDDTSVEGVVLNVHDVTERKALEEHLSHQAFHDGLTGLANRVLFRDRVERALAASLRSDHSIAVLFCDLDGFKTVNDSLGHAAGDRLLVAVAERLRECLRPGDTVARLAEEGRLVARLGGDEFAILLEGLPDETVALAVADRLLQVLRRPVQIHGHEVTVGMSIGIATSRGGHADPDDLLRDADAAMYVAKSQGKGCHAVFAPAMHTAALERLELHADLPHALERGQLTLAYQPVVDLATGKIEAVEALLRWWHPTRGPISPTEFIPAAEEAGLIGVIGHWVLTEACRQLRAWQDADPAAAGLGLSVNLSARQLDQPDLPAQVAGALQSAGLSPARLTLELTESSLVSSLDRGTRTLEALHRLGVRLAIDDFGTGWSSLAYLGRFPVDVLKIDRSFVSGLGTIAGGELINGIVNLAHALGVSATAEGIETAEQAGVLRAAGCESAQGFHFARPLAPEELAALLATRAPLRHEQHALRTAGQDVTTSLLRSEAT
jgi:diguanylate cyclase (GGDEF)-like protein/PAS domain S-box-containing protein